MNVFAIIIEIADAVAYNGINDTTKSEIAEILQDDEITNKTDEICEVIGAINYNKEQVRRVLLEHNLE